MVSCIPVSSESDCRVRASRYLDRPDVRAALHPDRPGPALAGNVLAVPRTPWLVDGQFAGHIRSARGLSQVLVDGAGHLVPMDQPAAALALLTGFLRNDLAAAQRRVTAAAP
jgi:Serine carboxypeptidase